MIKNYIIKSFISIIIYSIIFCQKTNAQPNHLTQKLADNYLKSFPTAPQKKEHNKQKKKFQIKNIKIPKLAQYTKRNIVYHQFLAKSPLYLTQQFEKTLNQYAWEDLHLFYGNATNPQYHLVSRINKTQTVIGEVVLTSFIANPTDDVSVLRKRQNILKFLLKNKNLQHSIQETIAKIALVEEKVLSLWHKKDPLYSKHYKDYMQKHFYFKSKALNKSTIALETRKRLKKDTLNLGLKVLYPLGMISFFKVLESRVSFKNYSSFFMPYYNLFSDLPKKISKKHGVNTPIYTTYFFSALHAYATSSAIKNYLAFSRALHYKALRMADLKTVLLNMKKLYTLLNSEPSLKAYYLPYLQVLEKFLFQKKDTEIGRCIHNLQTLPLHNWSYFLNNTGKLLASYKIFLDHKNEFLDTFYALGIIDTFSSIVELINDAKKYSNNQYIFTEFIQNASTPYIQLADMWNPFLDAKQAITNTINMDSKKGTRTIILTGPNAGGKSTFLTGVTTTLLLSQTFGIAPCKKATITPFNKINTYINVADDIADGKSLFMAEVDRANQHIQILKNLPASKFSFSIMDELFSGTNPKEGEAAAYSIMEYMGKYQNSLNIIATHFPKVMLLEKNAPDLGFKNFKVYIIRNKSKKDFQYTYKIIPGKSNQAIAIDILERSGYDISMLERARDILDHPEKYSASFF